MKGAGSVVVRGRFLRGFTGVRRVRVRGRRDRGHCSGRSREDVRDEDESRREWFPRVCRGGVLTPKRGSRTGWNGC